MSEPDEHAYLVRPGGNTEALVTTPTWERPTCTQSTPPHAV